MLSDPTITVKTGPSLSERFFPRPSNEVTNEEEQRAPPLEVCSLTRFVVHNIVLVQFRGYTLLLGPLNKHNRIT